MRDTPTAASHITSLPPPTLRSAVADRFVPPLPLITDTTQRRLVTLLIIFATLNALLWSFVRVPGSGGPDEESHFNVIESMVTTGGLATFNGYPAGKFAQGPVRAQVAHELTPNFTAIPVALAVGMIGSENYTFNVHVARLFMVVLYTITLSLSYLTLRRLFPRSPIAPICGVSVMCTVPMFTLVHTYYNNDAPAITASTFTIFALVRASQSDFAFRDTLLLGAALALVSLHKYTGFLVFPATLLLVTWHFYNRPVPLLRTAAVALGIAALFASWWYIRNWLLYGDPIGVAYTQAAVDATGGAPIPPRARGLSPIDFATHTDWLSENFATFWAGYGREHLKLPGAAYLTFLALIATGLIGLVVRLARSASAGRTGVALRIIAVMATMHLGLWFVSFWSSYTVDVAVHGRYVFPTFLAFIVLMTVGLSEALRWTRIPSMALVTTIPIMVAANGAYFIHSILPDVNH